MSEALSLLVLPLAACIIFTAIHSYLGFHVIKRSVIFVDLALAQIAMLGAGAGVLFGIGFNSCGSYWISLLFAVFGAMLVALTRLRSDKVPQEAVIGIVYVVAASVLILVLSGTGEGDQHIRQMLTGNLLLVSEHDLIKIAGLYSAVAVIHILFRKQFFLLSNHTRPEDDQRIRVWLWDFIFYLTFAVVITSSVRIAGVLVVFAFLIIPSTAALTIAHHTGTQLISGWIFGIIGSLVGLVCSYYFDFPTGASVVCVFGVMFTALIAGKKILKR